MSSGIDPPKRRLFSPFPGTSSSMCGDCLLSLGQNGSLLEFCTSSANPYVTCGFCSHQSPMYCNVIFITIEKGPLT